MAPDIFKGNAYIPGLVLEGREKDMQAWGKSRDERGNCSISGNRDPSNV